MEISQPRGVRDFGPSEAIARKEILGVVEEVFKRFGFYPIETPSIESLDVLSAKAYGEESTKEVYKIEEDDSALRFDLTVPMARYVAMNRSIPLPFKRYQIGLAWRREEPQRMRYREFLQADVDIVGSSEVASDAEVVATTALAIEELGINNYKILLNDRVLLDGILDSFNVDRAKRTDVIRSIDKLAKIGVEGVVTQLVALGLERKSAEKIIEFINEEGTSEDKLERVSSSVKDKGEIDKMNSLLELLKAYGIEKKVSVDLALARGLDYYTGFVWEFVLTEDKKRLPTIAAGGRYDNLIGLYASKGIPAVGCSIGIDRVYEALKNKPLVNTYAKLFVAHIGDNNYRYALDVANRARGAGVYTDLNITKRSISKQLEYANALRFRYAMILGDQERSANKVRLRDLLNGKEEILALEEALDTIKNE
jgi:histidyl-tRNA synthetase